MSLLDSVMRPQPPLPDAAFEAALKGMLADVAPDPLFVHRLRGETVNRYVSAREGHAVAADDRVAARTMGRLGRACLVASFALAASAMSVMAASQVAIPGDPLYGLKLRIEQVRLDVLPAHQDELGASMLAERIDELDRLAQAGRWDEALAMTPAIEQALERLVIDGGDHGGPVTASVQRHLVVLEGLVERLPDAARAAVQRVIDRAADGAPGNGGGAPANGRGENGNGSGGGAPPGLSNDQAPGQADQPPKAEHNAGPERTPRPNSTPKPKGTPGPAGEAQGGKHADGGDEADAGD